jgi:glycosyltransferase involved in cell wall biosynthesis
VSADASPETVSRISAVVCTRGRPDLAARAVASLREQVVHEVLVVDNAPPDDAMQRVVRDRFPGVRYVIEPTRGLDFARNRALSEARGDVIAFLDDDAVATPGWSTALAAVFDAHARVGACTARVEALSAETPAQRIFEANGGYARGVERIHLPGDASRPLHGRRAPLIAWAVSVGSGCSFALRRQLALDIGGFDIALDLGDVLPGGGDHDMLWRVLMSGNDVVYEPKALAHHEHRKEEAALYAQLAGHQRGLVAFLTKTAATVRGRERASVLSFLVWRLLKPGVRLARRAAGRDPLPARALWQMWGNALMGPAAYVAARRTARRRAAAGGE